MSILASPLMVAGTRTSGASVRTQNGKLKFQLFILTLKTRGFLGVVQK